MHCVLIQQQISVERWFKVNNIWITGQWNSFGERCWFVNLRLISESRQFNVCNDIYMNVNLINIYSFYRTKMTPMTPTQAFSDQKMMSTKRSQIQPPIQWLSTRIILIRVAQCMKTFKPMTASIYPQYLKFFGLFVCGQFVDKSLNAIKCVKCKAGHGLEFLSPNSGRFRNRDEK